MKHLLAVLSVAIAASQAAQAQIAEKKTLTLDGAKQAIAASIAEAKKSNATGVIAVVDDGGNLMALERLDNTFGAGANISIGKARTAVLFKRPSKAFEDIIGKGRTAMVALKDFTPLQGGVPIVVDGQIVGGIGVSGAASAQQDEELAIAGANALARGKGGSVATAAVTYLPKDKVSAAFVKGMPLLEVGTYKIHASHRTEAGKVEIHTKDTDIIYVVDGSATLVTGGTVADPQTVETDEIRGASIRGGETRQISKGDVIVVPNGVPHWFERVTGPLNYYVVKVRSVEGRT
ncbi:MAG TPA: heme-binding protein [Myxococcaceae bacterium]|nr:heme-binding protein [Myxococcaceae bacterium]